MKILKHLILASMLLSALSLIAGPGGYDKSYSPAGSYGSVYAIALQPDGRAVIGVNYSSASPQRLYSNGSADAGFPPQFGIRFANGSVYCVVVQNDGRIVIGGSFTSVNGTSRSRIARLNSDGSVDLSFTPTN